MSGLMHSLDDAGVFQWWEECRRSVGKNISKITHHEIQRGKIIFGYFWIRVPEIPSIECYRYLSMKGHECNAAGEIALDRVDADEYYSFQKSLMEG